MACIEIRLAYMNYEENNYQGSLNYLLNCEKRFLYLLDV